MRDTLILRAGHFALYVLALFASGVLLLGCGVGPAESSTTSSIVTQQQKFLGTFRFADGSPASGSTVILLTSGDAAITDIDGNFEITTAGVSGEVWIEAEGNWGGARLLLESIPENATEVRIGAALNESLNELRLVTIDVKQANSRSAGAAPSVEAQITPNRCSTCHEFRSEVRCNEKTWISLHRDVFICPAPEPEPDDPVSTVPADQSGADQDLDDQEDEDQADNRCTECHSDRGSPRCSSASWRSQHSWYRCDDDEKEEKKKKKKKKKKQNEKALIDVVLLIG